jgi:uncharacterized protein YhaN
MQGRLKALCQEAGCETPAELPEIESRSAQARQLTETLQTVDKGLLQLGGGASLADFVQEARAVDRDALPSQIAQLHGQIEQLTAEKERLLEAKGGEEQLLNQMDGSPRAAEAAEEAQTLLAQIEAGVAEYVRLQLASAVLHGGIERYRQQNQGPVVQRASELFAHLTRGSFDGLDVGVNDKDELTLFGLRMRAGTKQQVAVAGMSEGTADQLYLALRLASLETYLEKKEPLPFIVDDILVNFDDDRALATLQEFARLSARTQVIFFTHHRHLVELARQHLDQDVLFTHRLQAS